MGRGKTTVLIIRAGQANELGLLNITKISVGEEKTTELSIILFV